MKKIFKIYLLGILVLLFSCNNDDYELGEKLSPSDLQFTIVQDYSIDEGGNTVILTNNTPGTISIWDYGTGKSNKAKDTIRYAFAGEYTIQFSAATAGGIVEAEPVTITVTEDNFEYISDPLWEAISGGVGNSKKWYLDLDAEGTSRYFAGPLYFYGTENGWLEDGNAWDGGDTGCYGDDCWNWSPDWPSNQWLMDAADFGYMEFSLDGGPFVTVDHLTIPTLGTQEGTYYLDLNSHMLTMSGAQMIHNIGYDTCSSNWGNITVFSLTEDTMQLGVIREAIGSCSSEGPAMIVYNFISEEYRDNWVPEDPGEPECDEGFDPSFSDGELLDMLTGGAGAGRVWLLDATGNPVDWIINCMGWTTGPDSSYNWGWNDDWTAISESSWIRFDQFGGGMNYVLNQEGTQTTGSFSIDENMDNGFTEIILDGATLIQNAGSWMTPTTNTLTVVKAFNDSFETNGIWFGTSYNPGNNEWLSFHYVPDTSSGGSGGGGGGGTATDLPFDNSKLVIGDIEENGNLRLELYNEYGATVNDPGLNPSDVAFQNQIEVTFTLSGITLNSGAVGTYDAKMYFADADWNPNGDGAFISVTGDGTYTITYDAPSAAQGCIVFVIDVLGLSTDISDMEAVTATIDSITMY
ncbi:hypothetical protein [Mangrovimonas sp. ST2L15]|uniref:hypothetical protein n=1 Tax=Mangrovimonas sp. ST2L15 TaxID=1645916 RepID=UPI0018D19A5C|nr:hypothetical protein [Mangrovimonas sp. ST2L15]